MSYRRTYGGSSYGSYGGGFSKQQSDAGSFSGTGVRIGEQVQDNKHYEALGVDRNSTAADIKKGYLAAAKVHHPDKGGNAEKFNEIQQAYEVLSDPQKRQMYDTYGEKGSAAQEAEVDVSDLISMLFGGRRASARTTSAAEQRPKQMEKVKPVKKILHVTLEDIYLGHIYKIPQTSQRCCVACNGFGGTNETMCYTCSGKGQTIKLIQARQGVYHQTHTTCHDCLGKGKKVDKSNACQECQGLGVSMRQKVMEVVVEKGAPQDHAINMFGEGDETPGCLAGDIIMIVDIKPHEDFVRVGADLIMKKKITLLEALTGVKSTFVHLDGNITNIETVAGDIIGFGEKRVLPGLGLPFFGDNGRHGNLIIEFSIEMPTKNSLSTTQLYQLKSALPGQEHQRLMPGRSTTFMKDYNEADLNTNVAGGNAPTYSANSEQPSGTGCNPQ